MSHNKIYVMHVYACTNSETRLFQDFQSLIPYLRHIHPTEGNPLWLDIIGDLDEDNMDMLRYMFHLHPLTVDDIVSLDSSTKWELFDSYIFLLCFMRDDDNDDYCRLSIVIGETFVLTFHETDNPAVEQVRTFFAQPIDSV